MNENPYASPRELADASPARSVSSLERSERAVLPLMWAGLLIFALLTCERIPLEYRVLTTLITLAAVCRLPGAARGFGHVGVAPIYVILLLFQYAVWTFPGW